MDRGVGTKREFVREEGFCYNASENIQSNVAGDGMEAMHMKSEPRCWYFAKCGGQRQGPYTGRELFSVCRTTTYVWREGMPEWKPMKQTELLSFAQVWSWAFSLRGRASRRDFLQVLLAIIGLHIVLTVLVGIYVLVCGEGPSPVALLVYIACGFLQWLFATVQVRRLHDLNFSGWWVMLVLPWQMMFPLTVFPVSTLLLSLIPSTRGTNRFGREITIGASYDEGAPDEFSCDITRGKYIFCIILAIVFAVAGTLLMALSHAFR